MSMNKIVSDMKRVWKVTRKPTKSEYMKTLEIVLIGFLFVGVVGFIIELIWQLLLKGLF